MGPESKKHQEEKGPENLGFEGLEIEGARKELENVRDAGKFIERAKKLLSKRLTRAAALLALSAAGAHYEYPHETDAAAVVLPGIHEIYEKVTLTPEEQKYADRIRNVLGESVGNVVLSYIETLDSVKGEEERTMKLEKEFPNVEIKDFEKAESYGLSDDFVREVLETLPKGAQHNIDEIKFIDHERSVGPLLKILYGNKLKNKNIGAAADSFNRSIHVYKSEKLSPRALADDLEHEINHLGDWSTNRLLTKLERLKLLDSVLERMQSPDRFKSKYVASIPGNESAIRLRQQAAEYFAESVHYYLSAPPGKGILPEKDEALVEDLIHKMDPQFDRDAEWRKRQNVYNQ